MGRCPVHDSWAPLKIALFPVLCYTLGIDLVWG